MIYDLLLAGPPVSPTSLAEALAEAVRTEGADLDVADRDDDQSRRDWTAPVLCGCIRLRGDLSLSLDAVEHAVAQLPHVRVSDLPEIALEKGDM
ncbi:hypothetical protein ACWKT3_30135 [Streptomyces violaceus]